MSEVSSSNQEIIDRRKPELDPNLLKVDTSKLSREELIELTDKYKEVIETFACRDSISKIRNTMLKEKVVKDKLTGLYNREKVEDKLDELIQKDFSFSVLFIDLGNFKKINDDLGHKQGDRALILFGNYLNDMTRDSDLVIRMEEEKNEGGVRYGGDEFILVVSDTDDEIVNAIVARLTAGVVEYSSNLEENDAKILRRIIPDIGVATRQKGDKTSITELIEKADSNMYLAKEKRKGGNEK